MTNSFWFDIFINVVLFVVLIAASVYSFMLIMDFISDRWYGMRARKRRDREEAVEFANGIPLLPQGEQRKYIFCESCNNWVVDRKNND